MASVDAARVTVTVWVAVVNPSAASTVTSMGVCVPAFWSSESTSRLTWWPGMVSSASSGVMFVTRAPTTAVAFTVTLSTSASTSDMSVESMSPVVTTTTSSSSSSSLDNEASLAAMRVTVTV